MRRPGLLLGLALACLALSAGAAARTDVHVTPVRPYDEPGETAIFYYPWFGVGGRDGEYYHWTEGGHDAPSSIGARFFPARGIYSSSDPAVVAGHMDEIASVGIDTVVVSWWGRGSREDALLPALLQAARERELRVAAHLEPYDARTPESTAADIAHLQRLGIGDFYVYGSTWHDDAGWAAVNAELRGVRVFAHTRLPGKAKAGGFAGLYTYDVLVHTGREFARMCESARRLKLVCAPSVGPGYDARRATRDSRVRSRRDGATYDHMWASAIRAGADLVTITSYNEWAEGTQIEPAARMPGYASYNGAWGRIGDAAERSYLERTAYWTLRLSKAMSAARRR